jgi:glycosyltransferase involved in cell wall biosynthesis
MPHNWRSQVLADAIQAQNHFIHFFKFKRAQYAPLKYVLQFFKTVRVLKREKPTAVVVATPPVFAAAAVYSYAKCAKVPLAIDAHTGSFLDPKWRWSRRIHGFLSQRALVTLVTNAYLASVVTGEWGGKALILPGAIPDLRSSPSTDLPNLPLSAKLNVAVLCSFSNDEPILEILEAASNLVNQVTFYVTGDSRKASRTLRSNISDNIVLTGFLPRKDLISLLHAVDVVMVLTKRDHTMQLGGYEAIAVEKPLITSAWAILKQYFSLGTLHTDNTPSDIQAKLCLLLDDLARERLSAEMKKLKRRRTREWREQAESLRALLEQGS